VTAGRQPRGPLERLRGVPSLRRAALAALAPLVLALIPVADAATAADQAALGSPAYLAPVAHGWGKAHPRHVFNGGDPSGDVSRIRWRHWGEPVAVGHGLVPLLRPEGGYYARRGRIVLRAEGLGTCPDGTTAYTRLEFRAAHRPGGPIGRYWHPWAGTGDICG
jgi:hypothetical protein